jgi:hypothetical protein
MMSAAQFGDLIQADFFTTTHRISGGVQTGPKPLSDLLNDRTQSYLLLFSVSVSRLDQAIELGTHAPVAYLSKDNLNFVIVPSRETRAPDGSRFTAHEYQALVTLPGCEIRGKFVGPHRLDLKSFSPAILQAFVVLTEASARLTGVPEATFGGEAILVSRARLESLCLVESEPGLASHERV